MPHSFASSVPATKRLYCPLKCLATGMYNFSANSKGRKRQEFQGCRSFGEKKATTFCVMWKYLGNCQNYVTPKSWQQQQQQTACNVSTGTCKQTHSPYRIPMLTYIHTYMYIGAIKPRCYCAHINGRNCPCKLQQCQKSHSSQALTWHFAIDV